MFIENVGCILGPFFFIRQTGRTRPGLSFLLTGRVWPYGTEPFRSRANSLARANRPIGPGPIRSLAFSLPDQFVPWPFRSQAFSLPFVLWNCHSLNMSIAVYFRCRALAFTPKIKYKIPLRKIN